MTRSFGRVQFRSLEQVRDLFDGLELVAPGLVRVPDWRPDEEDEEDASAADDRLTALGLACAGVARKP
jgi:S-adenosyl methyltransferase